jgi:predicted RNA-binding protein YlqC (UPF0109 family)
MKELVEHIAKSLVSNPEQVEVESHETSSGVRLLMHVADEDKGMIIGRRGRMVNAMRVLLRVMGARAGLRVNLDIS